MCRICGKYICPSACPSYGGKSAERGRMVCECSACGVFLCEYDDIKYSYRKPYCDDCYFSEAAEIYGRKNERGQEKRRGNTDSADG